MKYSNYILLFIITLLNLSLLGQTKILVSTANELNDDASIFQLNENGDIEKELFNFKNQPLIKTGNIWHLNSNKEGSSIYFSSDNASVYSLSRRNIFKISPNGKSLKQLTPGPNSGQLVPSGQSGTIKGKITDSNGYPYSGAAIFIEGLPLKYSDANGYFKFDNVPQGHRWVTGYKPATLIYKSQPVFVTANLTSEIILVPESDYKSRFEMPTEYNNSIYYRENNLELYKRDLNGENRTKVFTTVGLDGIGGFDIANQDGQIIISDYRTGTSEQRGLYTCDKNGNNLSLFLDFKQDNNWDAIGEVFWSPDKSKIAVKASYNYYTYFVIIDANTKNILGTVYFDQNYTIYNVDLYGWSPDGKWLLYSNWIDKPTLSTLAKIKVGENGSINPNDNVNLLVNKNITSACWININNTNSITQDTKSSAINKIKIFPNPTNSYAFLDLNQTSIQKGLVGIYNLSGQKLISKIITGKLMKIDLNSLKQGVYFLKLTNTELNFYKRLIITR